MPSDLVTLFLEAVKVDATSQHERPAADFVRRYLSDLPVVIAEDRTAGLFHGESGNLICTPPGFDPARPAVVLLAHLDTPRSTADVRPVVAEGRIASDGTTALGVDNRAGVSILLQALRTHCLSGARSNFLVVFTVGEETGLYGSRYLDLVPFNIESCFVFDCSKRPGVFIRTAVGCSVFRAVFTGVASHAAVAPERGVNAIRIAATAVTRIPLGRLSPVMTSNIGSIDGGTALNIIPDRCTVQGEVRAFDRTSLQGHLALVERTFGEAARESGGGVEFEASEDFPPFMLQPGSPVVQFTSEVLRSVGLVPSAIDYLGGSDANMLNGKGIPSVNLGIGAQNPHGNDEFILIEDLHKSLEIACEIIRRYTMPD